MNLDEIKNMLETGEGDYYENIVLYIEALIENDQKDLAFEHLKEELEQAYIPSKTQSELERIFTEHYEAELTSKQVSIDEAKSALVNLDISNIVAYFYTINLRLLTKEVCFYLENSTDYVSISILLYNLIEQKVEIEFEVKKFNRVESFNTQNLEIVDTELLIKYHELFEKEFEKTPSFVKYCMDLLNYYFLVVFPFKMDYDFEIYEEIVKYVKKISNLSDEVNNVLFTEIIEYEG